MTKYLRVALAACLAAVLAIGGCVKQSQKTGGCTGTLDISFYSRTRCSTDVSYPGASTGFVVCIFDDRGVLAGHRTAANVNLDSGYRESFELPGGLYTAVAWTGLEDDYFDLSTLTDGTTLRSDLLLRVRRQQDIAVSLEGAVVYMGESPAFYIDGDQPGEVTASVNMLEVTNRLSILVEGLPDDGEGYTVTVEADNGSMNLDGTVAGDQVLVFHPVYASDEGVLAGDFTLLKLETGHTYRIVITRTATGTELYRGSLLGALILKNPEVDLLCDHDFTIRFTAEDQCDCGTYMIAEIWVNNWLVHSYSTDF